MKLKDEGMSLFTLFIYPSRGRLNGQGHDTIERGNVPTDRERLIIVHQESQGGFFPPIPTALPTSLSHIR